MKIAHTADLHIGKRLHDVSLIGEQQKVLANIIDILKEEEAEALIIAGDIYDKPTPSAEAIKLLDEFISELSSLGIKLFAISGNHDSMERISFGSKIMSRQGMYFQENFKGKAQKYTLTDEFGELNVYMVPFIKPVYVGKDNYETAFAKVLSDTDIDYSKRNILIAHQFVTATALGADFDEKELIRLGKMPERCESESINVGGLDNISCELLKNFDYVALGHLHRRQSIGEEHIRYSGSPLKYSFSESLDTKSIEIVEIKEKGNINIRQRELIPPRDLRVIKGTLEQLTSKDVVFSEGVSNEDYICAIVTDEERVSDGASKLTRWYPNLLNIIYQRDMAEGAGQEIIAMKGKTPFELFAEYYEIMNKRPLNEAEQNIIKDILGGDGNET